MPRRSGLVAFALLALGAVGLLLSGLSPTDLANRARGRPGPPTPVVLQLKWWHQFQFAGYYAAQLKGFYEREGLTVEIREGTPSSDALTELRSGRVDFAVSNAAALVDYLHGRPLVAVAAVFQHSPYVLLTTRARGIAHPSDLAGKRVMLTNDLAEVQFRALLKHEGISMSSLTIVPHSWNVDALLRGEVDAMSAYSTAQPFELRVRGVEPVMIHASDYGVDFYDDLLVTRRDVADRVPDVVEAFRRASQLGWEYAMSRPDELASYVATLPGVAARGISREMLLSEATEMQGLVAADVVPAGHINPGRMERMIQVFVELDGAPLRPAAGFLFAVPAPWYERWKAYFAIATAVLVPIVVLGLVWVRQLRQAVARRSAELEREAAQRFAALAELRASEERLRAVVDDMPVLLGAFDGRWRLVAWNRECERVTGFTADEVIGRSDALLAIYPDLSSPERRAELIARASRPDPFEWTACSRAGVAHIIRWTMLDSRVTIPGWAHWGIGIDVTAEREAEQVQRSLEEKLQNARQLESLGLLAGGIAHDFNNLLTGILGNADLARTELPPAAPALESVALIEQAARRAADLTRQLLAYSGKERMDPQPVDVPTLVTEATRLIDAGLARRCRLRVDVPRDLPPVEADATRLQQVLMNLVLNAAEAVASGGQVTVRASALDADRELLAQGYIDDQLPEGRYVCIEVTDTGHGMSEAVRRRLFEPFFTTKFQGRGLGLAAALGTVRAHKGTMIVRSAVGRGTTCLVLLPVSSRAATAPALVAPPDGPDQERWRGRGLVLIVDDEEGVRKVAHRMLVRMGFQTAHAEDGQVAVEMVRAAPTSFVAVLLDLTMPRMGGEEALHQLRQIRPDLPVVFSSGYHEPDVVKALQRAHAVRFVQKPYKYVELVTRMREVTALAADDELPFAGTG